MPVVFDAAVCIRSWQVVIKGSGKVVAGVVREGEIIAVVVGEQMVTLTSVHSSM